MGLAPHRALIITGGSAAARVKAGETVLGEAGAPLSADGLAADAAARAAALGPLRTMLDEAGITVVEMDADSPPAAAAALLDPFVPKVYIHHRIN